MSNYNPSGGGLQYRGTLAAAPPNCNFQPRDPTPYDKFGYSLLDLWLNTNTDDVWILVSLEGTSTSKGIVATWVKISIGQIGLFSTTGNDLVIVNADSNGNVNIIGAGPIFVSGNPGTFTETITVQTATTVLLGVTTLATPLQAIAGIDTSHAVTPFALQGKIGTQTTDGIAYGSGSTSSISWTPAGTNGQVLIAATGLPPAFGSITSIDGTISISVGPNTIDLSTTGGELPTVTTTDATPTTLFSQSLIAGQAITIHADIVAAQSDYSAAVGGDCEATARRAGGGAIMVGTPVVNINEDSGTGSPTFNFIVSGNALILQVIGEVGITYNWKASVRFITV